MRALAVLAALAALPLALSASGQEYYVGFATRILIFGIAATSLNLILGYGGMVSFGHAAFFGAGAYTAAIAMSLGVGSAWVAWPLAMLAAALLALAIGAASLRTRGLYFIMITLAFAQMVLLPRRLAQIPRRRRRHAARRARAARLRHRSRERRRVLLRGAGDRRGIRIRAVARGRFPLRPRAAGDPRERAAHGGHRLSHLQAQARRVRHRRRRGGLAGALIANLNGRVGPGLLDWPQSGTLMVMVILGGVGHRFGGFLGAAVLLALEEVLSGYTIHWQLALGVLLLAVVLWAPRGLAALAPGGAPRG
jgi:branched-chain amino acid transport system permease protein